MDRWEKSTKQNIFKNKIFNLNSISCYNKKKDIHHDFYILDTMDWVNIVATTKDNQFIMVKQHRLGTDKITIETPGGLIDSGESPEVSAVRELQEETGYKATKIHLLSKLAVNPAILSNHIYFFFAENCTKISGQNLDDAEDIEILLFSKDKIKEMIKKSEINHAIIVNALNQYFLSDFKK